MTEDQIPEQHNGGSSDTSSAYSASSPEEAKSFFQKVKQRLLDVNHWGKIASLPSADFTLCDQYGRPVQRSVIQGDYFRISIPGPGNNEGDGYDWVRVESVEEHSGREDSVVMTVRPASNPTNKDPEVSHFFTDAATSSFVVERKENDVFASVHGRNEKPNAETKSLTDKIRNLFVGSAAITAFSKIQWKGLVNGLVAQ